MKVYDILNEDGRIVKGVNTTPDVGPNEIKTQAAKFGNTVDKDGRPPTLSKKVKGASTNVAFNIGLAEALALADLLDENFADGKKPGRKGLAKRSGVNTKASVSSLRKTAKNSSGEKQRMAHWLANMKAGRAKKK